MEHTAHVAQNNHRQTNRSIILRFAPPLLRTFVLVSSATLALVSVLFVADSPTDTPTALAQTTPVELVDYDIDDDGLIEVRDANQLRRIDDDLNGDGTPGPLDGLTDADAWRAAFPNPMPGMGCQLTDSDNDPNTADEPTCIGYELFNDVDTLAPGAPTFRPIGYHPTGGLHRAYTAIFKGNGYRILNPTRTDPNEFNVSLFSRPGETARIEGLGVVNPNFRLAQFAGGIANFLQGTLIGNYVVVTQGDGPRSGWSGGLVGRARGTGKIINSFFVGRTGDTGGSRRGGGLVGDVETDFQNRGTLCRNSYFSGLVRAGHSQRGLLWGRINTVTPPNRVSTENCVADTTTDPRTSNVWPGASNAINAQYGATYAQMTAATGYTGPFANWNSDEDNDGEPDDVWDFGAADELPVLKGYGHDRTMVRARSAQLGQTPADTVNICTRTLAVANEIIRHLQDNTWREIAPPNEITAVPDDIAALTPCTSGADTRTVSVDQLRDFVVTTEDNPFRLNPDRTTPPSDRLTSLHGDDLAYLVSASHFDFSDNSLTAIPPRLFQGIKLRRLDLSDNAITSLHADTFAVGTAIDDGEETGNVIDLSNNRLTTAGLPDRIFDGVPHMNGISLRSNALAAVNTRWFERLGNLGRTDPMDTTFRPVLGLQLAGNTISEHYYWQRAFDDFRMNRVVYTGDTAGAALRTAITAQMTEAGTDTTNLDLMSTSHLANGELGSGPCPDGLTSGPAGSVDFDGNPIQCLAATRWTPPWQEGVSTEVRSISASSSTISITVSFQHTADPALTAYQFRFRRHSNDANAPWTQAWRTLPIDLATSGTKTFSLPNLERGTFYQFQMRAVSNGGAGPSHDFTQGTEAQLPAVNKILPGIREVSVQAGQQVRLEVDIYSRQDTIRNDLSDDADGSVVFQWSESPAGGGAFASPSTARRVTYTAPDLPGTYTVLAEAQPIGICTSHHRSTSAPTAEDRAPCIATFTVRVSRAPVDAGPQPDPVNPAGLIPTSLTDSAGVAYAVFTPVDGGTFTGEGITVSAPEGAVPDQQLLGVSATRSDIPVPPPIPGARMTVAGSYYTVNGIQRTGDAPVSGYALDDPIQACMPLPDIFRADISDVVVVNRNTSDGSLAILTGSVQQTPAGLVACGALGQLPATVAVANVGVIETPPDPPTTPEDELPETGATALSTVTTAWTMAVAAAIMAAVATGAAIMTARRRRSSDTPA